QVTSVHTATSDDRAPTLPGAICTDARDKLELREDEIVEHLPIRATIRGRDTMVQDWVKNWNREPGRLFELEEMKMTSAGVWSVRAHALRYWAIRYPKLYPRDPLKLLPNWARSNPGEFSKR